MVEKLIIFKYNNFDYSRIAFTEELMRCSVDDKLQCTMLRVKCSIMSPRQQRKIIF